MISTEQSLEKEPLLSAYQLLAPSEKASVRLPQFVYVAQGFRFLCSTVASTKGRIYSDMTRGSWLGRLQDAARCLQNWRCGEIWRRAKCSCALCVNFRGFGTRQSIHLTAAAAGLVCVRFCATNECRRSWAMRLIVLSFAVSSCSSGRSSAVAERSSAAPVLPILRATMHLELRRRRRRLCSTLKRRPASIQAGPEGQRKAGLRFSSPPIGAATNMTPQGEKGRGHLAG